LKVLTYARGAEEHAGILIDDTVYDIEACAAFFAAGPMPRRLMDILETGKAGALGDLGRQLAAARQARAELPLACWAGIKEVRVLAPLPRPPKIICLGLNYRDHAEEQGAKLPEVPLLFAKAPTAVIGPGQPIVIPASSEKVDYEGELAFVVGTRVKHAEAEEAARAIFGYCCMNDVSERDIQRERVWLRAKSIDTFAPLGPWIVTADEVPDPLGLKLVTRLNSQVMQAGTTGNLIFTPVDLVVFITRYMTLEPGDVVSTGTPAGVGVFRKPPVFLKAGDVVEITIDGIGTLANPVIKAS